jgi:hypothetical protein
MVEIRIRFMTKSQALKRTFPICRLEYDDLRTPITDFVNMLSFHLRLTAIIFTVILCSTSVDAQLPDQIGDVSDGQTGADGSVGELQGLDANEAFSEVQREDLGVTEGTGRGFSAASVAPPDGTAGAITPGGIGGGLGGFGGVGGFGRLFNGETLGSSQAARPIIRTRLRSAIQIQPRAPSQVGQTAMGRFQSLPRRPQLRGVSVRMQGRTAVLQGRVANESDRRMSELLMRLEPGISRVENRVVIAQ